MAQHIGSARPSRDALDVAAVGAAFVVGPWPGLHHLDHDVRGLELFPGGIDIWLGVVKAQPLSSRLVPLPDDGRSTRERDGDGRDPSCADRDFRANWNAVGGGVLAAGKSPQSAEVEV